MRKHAVHSISPITASSDDTYGYFDWCTLGKQHKTSSIDDALCGILHFQCCLQTYITSMHAHLSAWCTANCWTWKCCASQLMIHCFASVGIQLQSVCSSISVMQIIWHRPATRHQLSSNLMSALQQSVSSLFQLSCNRAIQQQCVSSAQLSHLPKAELQFVTQLPGQLQVVNWDYICHLSYNVLA